METLTYLRAGSLPPEQVVAAFNRSFQGYFVPMTHTVESLRMLTTINDVALEHSFVARDERGELVGIVLLAVRGQRGWIGGMGLAPEWRGRGQAAPLMRVALDEARVLGLASVELEVLAQNTPAWKLYARLGFQNVRSLAVFMGALANTIPLVANVASVRAIPVERALADFDALHPVPSPWQRERPSLEHMASSLQATALMDGETVRAAIVYMASGNGYSVMDFGSRGATLESRRDDALALIHLLLAAMPQAPLRAINVPPGDALGDALTLLGCPTPHTQWEMLLTL